MATMNDMMDLESRRMELRGVVRLAGEVIAQYWPMRTFVHHNPLHSLEYLPFGETVRRGKQFLNGEGYLPSDVYRAYVTSGRIRLEHVETVLQPLTQDRQITLGSRTITHGEVLRACLTEGLCSPAREPLDDQLEDPDRDLIERIARQLER
ncbi:MAG: putative inorganic carbon transporter subunit DabA, partial [Nitrospira sp.]